jgi:glucokinase
MTMILAGDIGGTKCNLALFVENGAGLRLAAQQRYSTSEFGSLEQLIEKFFYECKAETALKPTGKISAAGFGVAGAVVDGRLVANNIPWQLTTAGLADKLQLGLDQRDSGADGCWHRPRAGDDLLGWPSASRLTL